MLSGILEALPLLKIGVIIAAVGGIGVWITILIKNSGKLKELKREFNVTKEENKDLWDSIFLQNERQDRHEKRMREIDTGFIPPDRVSDMLSTYPAENAASNASLPGKGES